MNEYDKQIQDDLARGRVQRAGPATPLVEAPEPAPVIAPVPVRTNEYDQQIEEDGKRELLREVLYNTRGTTPDKYAEIARMSRRTDLPIGVVERQLDLVREKAKISEGDSLLNMSPITAKMFMVHPYAAKLGHDDTENMSAIEQVLGFSATAGRSIVAGMFPSFTAGITGKAAMGAGLLSSTIGELMGQTIRFNPFKGLEDFFTYLSKNQEQLAEKVQGDISGAGFVEGAAYSGFRSLGQNVGPMGLGLLLQAPQLALGLMTAVTGGTSYVKGRAAGLGEGEAAVYAATQELVEYYTEKFPLEKLYAGLKANAPFLKTLAINQFGEQAGEQVATVLQDMSDWVTIDRHKGKSIRDYVNERPSAAAQTFIATLIGSGGQVTILKSVDAIVNRAERQAQKAQAAQEQARLLQQVDGLAKASKLRERDPQTFKDFVDLASEDGPVQDIYIGSEALQQSGVDLNELAKVSPAVAAQVTEAVAAGTDVVIPVGEYAANIAGTDMGTALLDHLRTDADAMSAAEAKVFMQSQASEMKAAAERVLEEKQQDTVWQQSAAKVEADVLEKLTKANRFTKDVNAGYAQLMRNFYVTTAAAMGVTPTEMAAQFPVNIQAEAVVGPEVLEQQAVDEKTIVEAREYEGRLWGGAYGVGTYNASARDSAKRKMVDAARTRYNKIRENAGLPPVTDWTVRPAELVQNIKPAAQNQLVQSLAQAAKPAVTQHVMDIARGEREVGKHTTFTAEEKEAMVAAAKMLGIPEAEVRKTVRGHKLAHPPSKGWDVLYFDGVELDEENKPKYTYKKIPYSFNLDKNGKAFKPGTSEYQKRVAAVARAGVDNVREIYARAQRGNKHAKQILGQAGWYKNMRSRLRHEFGGLGDLFADLLGATSPNTPVRSNWSSAVEALRRATRGDYDDLIVQWEQWVVDVDNAELEFRSWFAEQTVNQTKKAVKESAEYQRRKEAMAALRELPKELYPKKENAKNFGVNGRHVVRAMVNTWRVVRNKEADIGRGGTKPKAVNFSGNLIGYSNRATIDVWAARWLNRLAGRLRVPARAETGVTGELLENRTTTLQFGFGQDVFDEAVKQVRGDPELSSNKDLANVNPDDLQAIVWFVEKELWAQNGWTSAEGEGGSFELEADLTGSAEQDKITDLRKIINSGESTPAEKESALAEIIKLERTVDRLFAGLSIQQSEGTQGIDYVPTDADMSATANELREAIYSDDTSTQVIASKAMSTRGHYGPDFERSFDMEIVAREGFDPSRVMLRLLEVAQRAKQDSVFLSRVLRVDEQYDPLTHRPGIELYFQSAEVMPKVQEILNSSDVEGAKFYTVVVDGRRSTSAVAGAMPPAVGLRIMHLPELSARFGDDTLAGMDDSSLSANIEGRAKELRNLAESIASGVPGVSFGHQFWYEVETRFNEEYQEQIDALTNRLSQEGDRGDGRQPWQGLSVREAVAGATRQLRASSQAQGDGQPGVDVGGGAVLGQAALAQGNRGQIVLEPGKPPVITLLANADLSTFLHESGHFFLEVYSELASRPGAPAQIQQDVQRLMDWFGVKDIATWRSMSLAEQRPYHEKFAESFEDYLFEGKAPTAGLQSLFNRFRSWILSVYRGMRSQNVQLTDEVRGVFDRMPATNDEILAAEAGRGYAPVFKSAEEMGVTPEQWRAYQELGHGATQEAVTNLQTRSLRNMQWLENARSRKLKQLQREAAEKRKAVRAEVTAEVEAEPINRAYLFLTKGILDGEQLVGAKLNVAALRDMYGDGPAAKWRYLTAGKYGLIGEEGLHPDQAAEMFGFTSGDHLVTELLARDPIREQINGLTDQRMLERYGDLVDERSMRRAVDAALNNEARGKFIAAELQALEDANRVRADAGTDRKGRRRTFDVLARAAREFADTIIARKKVRDIKPSQYAAGEERAGEKAAAAQKKGDVVLAATEKRNQLIHHYAERAAEAALIEVEKAVRYLKKFDVEGTRRSIDPDYRDQIDQLLERYDLRKSTTLREIDKRKRLVAWVEEQRENGFEPVLDPTVLARAERTSYKDVTLEELRGLVDTVKNIEHLGRLKNRLLTARDKRAFDAVVDDIQSSIRANATKTIPVKIEQSGLDKTLSAINSLFALHRKLGSFVHQFDGQKDGGVVFERFLRPINEAGDNEARMRESSTIALTELFKQLDGLSLREKMFIPAINNSLSREARITIALNWGNADNRQRVMSGDNWSETQVQAIIDTLSKQEMDFVQSMWDYIGTYWPDIAAKEQRVTGVAPQKVEATPVQTTHGEYRGGYFPIKYDPNRSTRAEADSAAELVKQHLRGLYTRATTRRGHTEARAAEVNNRPVRKDFSTIFQHLDQVIHDLAWHETLIDTNRLLRAPPIDAAIREHYGPEVLTQLRNTLEDIAAGDVPAQNVFERGANHIRKGATIAGLGYNLTTAFLQPIGLTQSMVRIGPKWVGKGLAIWMRDTAHMENTAKLIYAKSTMMRLRGKTLQREINEIRNKLSGKSSAIEASFFYLIQKLQLVADIPTWLGQYEKARANGADEADAIAQADQAVLAAQGGGQIKDLAGIQRGGPYLKLWTNFYSFFNTTFNLTAESYARTKFSDPLAVGRFAVDMLLLYTIPAVLGALLRAAMKGETDDEDELARKLIAEQLTFMLGTMVGIREFSATAQVSVGLYSTYTGPAGIRLFNEVKRLAEQAAQGEPDEAALKALNAVGGVLFHYPSGQVQRTAQGVAALMEGDTQNPFVLVTGPPAQR